MSTLAQEHDCLLLDLDGTVFRGHEPTPGAVETLAAVTLPRRCSSPTTPPADRPKSPSTCAPWASPPSPTTSSPVRKAPHVCCRSSCSPARRCSSSAPIRLPPRSRNVGLKPVRLWSDDPVAVVQGHSPQTGWPDLAEAALAIRGGALWVAANVDRTLPSERGLLPGNGSMVAALRAATDSEPQVAGKPAADPVDGCVVARQVSHPAGRRRPSRHRHRGRQRRRPAQPAGAQRCQHRRRYRARRRRTAAQLHRRRPALAVRPRRQPPRRAAPGVARRRRPVRGDRAVDRQGPEETRCRWSAPPPARCGTPTSTAGASS